MHGDAVLAQRCSGAHAAELQQEGRVNRACTHDHLAAGRQLRRQPLARLAVERELDAESARPAACLVNVHARHRRARHHLQSAEGGWIGR